LPQKSESEQTGKIVNEHLCLAFRQKAGLDVSALRIFNTASPVQIDTSGMVIPRLVRQAIKNDPNTCDVVFELRNYGQSG
jgi:UDP-glucose 4-epimerase